MANTKIENVIAAVDIGTTKVCTVIAEVSGEEINIIGVGWQENHGVLKGSIINISETADAIKKSVEKAEEMADLKVESLIASISGRHIMGIKSHGGTSLSHTKQKEINEEDKERAIELSTSVPISHDREILHIVPVQYVVDSQDEIKNPIGMTGLKLEVDVYIITAATTAIDNIKKCIQRAGYKLEDIILQPIASSQAVLYQDEKDIGVLMIDIGGGTIDMALYNKDALRFSKVIPVGGSQLTNDIVQGLQTSKNAAEEIKKKYGLLYSDDAGESEFIEVPDMTSDKKATIHRRDIIQYIKPRAEEMVEFVKEELRKEGIDKAMYGSGVVVTGGSALLHGMERLIKEQMNVRARVGVPMKEKIVGLYDIINTPEYSTVIGLIDYYIHEQGINNHFLGQKSMLDRIIIFMKNLISEFF